MELISKFLEYLEVEKNYSLLTIKAYKKDLQDFKLFVEKYCNDSILINVEYFDIRSWVVSLNEAKISNRSINRKISSLKSFYNYLQKIEMIIKNPLSSQKSLRISKKVMIPFSELEVEEAMSIRDDDFTPFEQIRDKLIIHLLYASGIRQAELIGLQIKDVDFELSNIKVLGKRNKERIIPMYDDILKDIKEYITHRSQVEGVDSSLFVTKKGGKMYSVLVYRIINSYFSKVSTKEKKSPHVLRHSYATDLVNNGADLNSVKELLGHSSLAATQVYTHNSLEKLKKVYNQAHPRSAKKQ